MLFELIQADAHLSIPLASHLSISRLFAVQVTNLGKTERGMRCEASPMKILIEIFNFDKTKKHKSGATSYYLDFSSRKP